MIRHIDWTERMANSDTPVICIVVRLARVNAWSELS